jgi:hypothetical protein
MEDRKLNVDCVLKLLDQTSKVNLSLEYIFPSKKLYYIKNSYKNYEEYFYINNIDDLFGILYKKSFFDISIYDRIYYNEINNLSKYLQDSFDIYDLEEFINESYSNTKINILKYLEDKNINEDNIDEFII